MKFKLMSPAVDVKNWILLADSPLDQLFEFSAQERQSIKQLFGEISVSGFATHRLVSLACAVTAIAKDLAVNQVLLEEEHLDAALTMSFPASDPISISGPAVTAEEILANKLAAEKV